MALVLADRVKVRSRTVGTGTFTLENTVEGFQSFSVIGDGNETYYGIVDAAGHWEIGRGTYTASGTTLSRNQVISSSNSDSLVDFPAGSKNVYVTIPSSLAGNVLATEILSLDLKGSVFADDSTLLVDATSGSIPWSVITGAPADTLNDVTGRGASTSNNITLTGILNLEQIQETYNVINAATGATDHNCSNGQIFLHTNIADNIQVNLTNLNLSTGNATNVTCVIVQGMTNRTINQLQISGSVQTLNWLNNTQPTGTAGNIDIFTFSILNSSGTYTVIGSASTFGIAP